MSCRSSSLPAAVTPANHPRARTVAGPFEASSVPWTARGQMGPTRRTAIVASACSSPDPRGTASFSRLVRAGPAHPPRKRTEVVSIDPDRLDLVGQVGITRCASIAMARRFR
jgi:hypothetical protein